MITAVVLTRNEEDNIQECLKALSWCDEVVVVDDNSTDKTVAIAEKLKAKVFTRSLHGDFSAQRNFGLEKAHSEWALFVDADERVSGELAKEIKETLRLSKSLENNGYYMKRRDFMWGKELQYGESGNIKLLRLARRDAGRWEGEVHETWNVDGEIGELESPLYHYPHQTIAQFLEEINYYTDIRAKELYEKGVRAYWWSIILYPKAKFFLNYFVKLGFRDGLPGLIFALVMSFHSFLVRGKLWLLWKKS